MSQRVFMITVLFTSITFVKVESATAAESTAKAKINQNSCSVRLSNYSISSSNLSNPSYGTGFCSGTMISDGILVTAAHCINDSVSGKIDNLKKIKKLNKIHIAFASNNRSQVSAIKVGTTSTISSNRLSSHNDRKDYQENGDKELINEDFVIVKLENKISGVSNTACPRLPTIADCKNFQLKLKEGLPLLTVNFYESKDVAFDAQVPSQKQFSAKATTLAQSSLYKYLVAQFQTSNKVIHLRRGDSGSGLIWQSPTGPIITGVQSAMSSANDQKSFFSNLCNHITSPEWAEFINSGSH